MAGAELAMTANNLAVRCAPSHAYSTRPEKQRAWGMPDSRHLVFDADRLRLCELQLSPLITECSTGELHPRMAKTATL